MKNVSIYTLYLCCLFFGWLAADFPVAYNGRIRPLEVYARLWLQEIYGKQELRAADVSAFGLKGRSATDLILKLHFEGIAPFEDAPLFHLPTASLKERLGLPTRRSHFSHRELTKAFHGLSSDSSEELELLRKKMEDVPELRALPKYRDVGEWLPLHTLRNHDNSTNFTAFSDETFAAIASAYRDQDLSRLESALHRGYASLAGQPIRRSAASTIRFPTWQQLSLERLYYRAPIVSIAIGFYLLALGTLFVARSLNSHVVNMIALSFMGIGFALHTALLAIRCYVLGRPPVSNMFETLLFVPWAAVLAGLIWLALTKQRIVAVAATIVSVLLLALLQVTGISSGMENVQAVLDSQYWLIIHVLMVVSSYGVFLVCGVLGHAYLLRARRERGSAVLHTMYLGTALLIPGTILGGVWAAQSWGRFWDWDPKESWAFITICVYLVVIHSYRFGRIGYFGLAIGSIAGLLAVSFTWYGVNYILGTGLHSYGFGAGGEIYYVLYCIAETGFLAYCLTTRRRSEPIESCDPK